MKKIYVKVKTRKREEKIVVLNKNAFEIHVKDPAREGRANAKVLKILSEYLNIPKKDIELVKGFKNRNKVFIIQK